mmetsp:Transcript_36496/g.112915  ORF Transcript_36496/g.112915 Transcript_36496/m.112915 type:complete len:641 (-) Transcript_36496:231-2153(-)
MLTKLGLDARTRHRTRIGRTLTGRGAELLISDADGKRAAGAMKLALALLLAAAASAQNENVIVLDGSGTTNPSKYFWDILALFEARAKPVVHMTYRAVGSSTGQFEFMGEDNPAGAFVPYSDFGSGDMPFNEEKYQSLQGANIEVLQVPFSLGAMSFFDNVPDDYQPEDGVKMSACVLADVFSGRVTTWDDPAIVELNEGFAPPEGEPIVVYHRTLGSSTTKGITTYLFEATREDCPDKWLEADVGSTIEWAAGTEAVQGSGGMSAAISATPWSVGYIDAGHGIRDGLGETALCNRAGTCQKVSAAIAAGGVQMAAEEALNKAVMPSDPKADFSKVSLMNMPGDKTWPIVAVSYLYIDADQTETGSKGPLLYAFVEYVLSDAGQALLAEYSFIGVPVDVKALGYRALDDMRLASDAKKWTFETSTVKGGGQEDYVISAKRRSWYEYELGELDASIHSHEDEFHGDGDEGDHDHADPDHDHDDEHPSMEEFATLRGRVNELQKSEDALKNQVADLQASLNSMTDRLAAMRTEVDDLDETCTNGCATVPEHMHDDDHDHDDDDGAKKKDVKQAMEVAAVGVVLGALALLVSLASCCRTQKLVSNRDPTKACVPGGGRAESELEIQSKPANGNGMQRGFDSKA